MTILDIYRHHVHHISSVTALNKTNLFSIQYHYMLAYIIHPSSSSTIQSTQIIHSRYPKNRLTPKPSLSPSRRCCGMYVFYLFPNLIFELVLILLSLFAKREVSHRYCHGIFFERGHEFCCSWRHRWGSYWLNVFGIRCCDKERGELVEYTFKTTELNFNTLDIRKSLPTLLFCMSRAASVQRYTSRRVPCTCQSSHANRRSTAPFTRYEAHACSFGGWECRSPPLRGRRREIRSDTGSGSNY